MPDISETLAPKSDQLDNIDLRGKGPRVFTITAVDVNFGSEQPITIHLAEFPRPWKPGKNMRRVLAECWGLDSDDWEGRQVELYADEKVKFGNETPGGTRISRVSHIDGPKAAAILLGQGKPGLYKVTPLPAATPATPQPTPAELAAQIAAALNDATTEAEVREWGNRAHARQLLDISPEGGTGTLREMVQTRLAALATAEPTEIDPTLEPGFGGQS